MHFLYILKDKVVEALAHPGFFLAIGAHILIFGLTYMLLKRLKTNTSWRANFLVFSITLIGLEVLLRLTGLMANYFEKKSGKYYSLYDYRPKETILKRQPGEVIHLASNGEFSYAYQINSWGYNDIEWDSTKPEGVLRVLALGDSFTEGFGAPQDSSWVAQIRNINFGRPIEWLNAGISAADPFINFHALRTELHRFQPDIIIQIISNQDLQEDIPLRGGLDRFKEDGSLNYSARPPFERLIAYSHLSRLLQSVLTIPRIFYRAETKKEAIDASLEKVSELIDSYANWSIENQNVPIIIIPYQVSPQMYLEKQYKLEELYLMHSKSESVAIISMFDCYKNRGLNNKRTFSRLWWPVDRHHTSQGYQMMAECIAEAIRPMIEQHPTAQESASE